MAVDPARMKQFRVQDRGRPEDIWQPLYDRVNVATTVPAEVGFFATARGSTATLIRGTATTSAAKTTRDTNLDTPQQIPAKGFQARGLSTYFVAGDIDPDSANTDELVADIRKLIDNGYLEWKVGDKLILEIPIDLIPAYTAIYGFASTTRNSQAVVQAQPFSGRGLYVIGVPITFQPFVTFTLKYKFDGSITLAQTLDVKLYLHGVMRRPT